MAYFLLVSFVLASPVRAQTVDEIVNARLLPGWRLADGAHMAGIEIILRNGWKTYWRAPGPAGIPPSFDWRRSRNLEGVEVIWPTPKVIQQGNAQAIGYADAVVLPLRVRPDRPGRPVELSGRIDIGVCSDVCVPVTLKLSGNLSARQGAPDPRIAAAMASRPFSAEEAGVRRVACRLSPAEEGLGLRAEIDMPRVGGATETVVVEVATPDIWVARARSARRGGRIVAETRLYHVEGRAFALDRSGIRLTVLGGGKAVEIQGCPAG
ncbi:protein-disulfide reductase DsbD domain-containing protein [Roseovarius salis]|uniref:protein-disulfide reductase DsbD domain-containing protein n=1 Tax=Roseovarius salis TaxID=3376063 RepID=UPI0037CC875D